MNAPVDASAVAAALFRAEGIPCPDVPPAFAASLREAGHATFATRVPPGDLYDLPRWRDEWLGDPGIPGYLAFGFAGHGLMSRAVHFYSVQDSHALFVQLRWASVAGDPARERAAWRGHLALGRQLSAATRALPAGRRLCVVHSEFSGSRWCWAGSGGVPEWRASGGVATIDAIAELQRISRG